MGKDHLEGLAQKPAPFQHELMPIPSPPGLQGISAPGEEHTGLTQSFKNISPPTGSLTNQPSSHPCVTVVAVICMIEAEGAGKAQRVSSSRQEDSEH